MLLESPALAALLLVLSYTTSTYAQQPSPPLASSSLLGPQWPQPTALPSDPTFQSTMHSIRDMLDSNLTTTPFNSTSFSVSVFSASEPGALWQYHHASALFANSTLGARSVDADSVYRMGSISKLMTVYLFLICRGDGLWGDPVTKYLPELGRPGRNESHAVADWSQITLGDLAGQMAGLNRNYGLVDFSIPDNSVLPPKLQELLPSVPDEDVPICDYVNINGTFVQCTEEEYLAGALTAGPIFRTAQRTVYSNMGYPLLGIILSRLERKPFAQLYQEHIIDALNLTETSYTVPARTNSARDMIPGDNATITGWDSSMGIFTPSGGNFASTNDFVKIGRAILNGHLLTQAQTSRWMKPTSFVNDIHAGVGRPWEIYRLETLGRTIDVYTKGGDWYIYNTLLVLIPDYGLGYTVFAAADPIGAESVAGTLRNLLPNLITEPIVNAVDAVAKKQAAQNFAGTYSDAATNSSLTITTDEQSALRVTAWTNDGHDLYNDLFAAQKPDIDWRLLPNELYVGVAGEDGHHKRVGFTTFTTRPIPERWIFGPGWTWGEVDENNLGNVPMGQVVFDVDESRRAVGVESIGLRVRLAREQ